MLDDQNILELDPPPTTQMVERVQFFAKALAYGVVNGLWSPSLMEVWLHESGRNLISTGSGDYRDRLAEYLRDKWENEQPQVSFLESFEYIKRSGQFDDEHDILGTGMLAPIQQYILTQKAFTLLEIPDKPPSVFISYRRDGSAAMALLVVYRLALEGVQAFIDMEMALGTEWEKNLRERVNISKYFVCVIGPTTHKSDNVGNEVKWAREAAESSRLEIIPLFQPDFILNPDENYPEWFEYLLSKNGIPVSGENPLDYKFALDRLLNRLGYAPL